MAVGGRHGARRLLLQALYQAQVGGDALSELEQQFGDNPAFAKVDQDYFLSMLRQVMDERVDLDARIAAAADRPVAQLDPVERGVLWIGLAELKFRSDIPPRVAINEAIDLAREFGAQDSYRYVNAVLDSASRRSS
jgi:N utilization substance protein B